jgi:hypothetical protein
MDMTVEPVATSFETLAERMYLMPTLKFWEAFRALWNGSDKLWPHKKAIETILNKRHGYHSIMTAEEFDFLLPFRDIEVFRAHDGRGQSGWSWTLSKRTALFYTTTPQNAVHGYCSTEQIIAVIKDDNPISGNTIIVDPAHVRSVEPIVL